MFRSSRIIIYTVATPTSNSMLIDFIDTQWSSFVNLGIFSTSSDALIGSDGLTGT